MPIGRERLSSAENYGDEKGPNAHGEQNVSDPVVNHVFGFSPIKIVIYAYPIQRNNDRLNEPVRKLSLKVAPTTLERERERERESLFSI